VNLFARPYVFSGVFRPKTHLLKPYDRGNTGIIGAFFTRSVFPMCMPKVLRSRLLFSGG
jgi:hypothetical protein